MPIVVVNGLLDVLVLMLTDACRRRPGDVPAILAPLLDQLRAEVQACAAQRTVRLSDVAALERASGFMIKLTAIFPLGS
jgi:hypothetical protein